MFTPKLYFNADIQNFIKNYFTEYFYPLSYSFSADLQNIHPIAFSYLELCCLFLQVEVLC